ncbi:RNA-binding protein 40 [Melipona quadrifasciata]|uniref:RNA-binding region-containing protein 3 n=1 Tax=Melipona quadrifasciata TaxID=166423 RepID=A0A0M8ZV20_9HYME|nr:RNA-binding protein 40 [Melipona quadrifasciata]
MTSEITQVLYTLRILHLPPELSDERRNELFKKYGAIKTQTLRLSKKYTMTFAKFQSQEIALQALLRLHQLNVRGQYLTVEFAKKPVSIEKTENNVDNDKLTKEENKKESTNRSNFQAFLQKLNSWSMNQAFTQPPPPNIQYEYSPPTRGTLIRIAIQLLKEPAFYTQVLHLMNRMNLPPPFEELEAEFPALKEVYDIEKYNDIFIRDRLYAKGDTDVCNEEIEEEESEIESNEEDNAKSVEIIPVKRKRLQLTKRLKIPKFINPNKHAPPNPTQKVVKAADMFEPVQRNGGFGIMFPLSKNLDTAENNENTETVEQKFITSSELANNRISANDQRLLPVFKNYHPGKPSNRLYIKNLAKQVEENDLHFIYRKYLIPELKTEFESNVRLMQEGRMKGQAFITLQNTEQAQLALDETNGFILKDKPMVVQFAKVSKS